MKNAKILIVDDNPNNLQLLGKTLKNAGYHVEFATNGKTALEWMNNQDFDLILLDIMMPEMDGYEVCKIIRSNNKLEQIPIIFLTAETGKESVLKGFELGAQDYVTKPFDSRELLARVGTHLEIIHNRKELQVLNKHLEEKVEERTKQLHQAHEELKDAHERLLELDKRKSEFLKLISHEIRTPLNGILGPIQLIRDRIGSEKIENLLNILDTSVSRLERFSYNALLITQLRTKKYKVTKSSLTLNKLINNSLEELALLIDDKQIKLTVQEDADNVHFEGEAGLLQTCMVNILRNAIEYSPHEGLVSIKTNQEGTRIICEIIDSGPGFPEEILSGTFELFSSTELNADGKLGLGLYLSHLIMKAHSGTMDVENMTGGGALVRLIFNT